MADKKRLFIAVRFSEEVEEALGQISDRLRAEVGTRARVSWVAPRNIHLTLQFLGDVDTGLVPKLADGLSGAFHGVWPFPVTLTGVGSFPPPPKSPRVIWVGMSQGADPLRTLSSIVHQVTEPLGFAREERAFSPHVTLGRVKEAAKGQDFSAVFGAKAPAQAGQCQIDRVVLVESKLAPSGPSYTTLDSYPLGQ